MKTVKSCVFLVLLATQLMSLPAKSVESGPPASPSASEAPQRIPSIVFKSGLENDQKPAPASGETSTAFGGGGNSSFRLKLFRTEGLSATNSRSEMFMRGDQVSFMANAPTPTVNKVLSLVSTIHQEQMDSTLTRWVQVLSLVSTRRINTAFTYSARLSKNSSFDSVISCNLHPAADSGGADVAAHIQYAIRF